MTIPDDTGSLADLTSQTMSLEGKGIGGYDAREAWLTWLSTYEWSHFVTLTFNQRAWKDCYECREGKCGGHAPGKQVVNRALRKLEADLSGFSKAIIVEELGELNGRRHLHGLLDVGPVGRPWLELYLKASWKGFYRSELIVDQVAAIRYVVKYVVKGQGKDNGFTGWGLM